MVALLRLRRRRSVVFVDDGQAVILRDGARPTPSLGAIGGVTDRHD